MCQNDDLTAAARAMQELREGWITSDLHVAFKTLRFDKRTRKVTSAIYDSYAWAAGWNAPPAVGRDRYSRDEAGLHAFAQPPTRDTDKEGVIVPVLVYGREILHYGANDGGTPTILATRLYLPEWAFRAVVRGRDISKPSEDRLRRAACGAERDAFDIRRSKASISKGNVMPLPKPAKAKKRKK